MVFNSPTNNPFAQIAVLGYQWFWAIKTTKTSHMIKALVTKYGEKNSAIPNLRFL